MSDKKESGRGGRDAKAPVADRPEAIRNVVLVGHTGAGKTTLVEALLAKGSLESAGIECFLGDDNLIRMDWLWSNLLGGIKLRVRQEDALVASRLLISPRSLAATTAHR